MQNTPALDLYIAYKFIEILTTPWEETEAYKLGIIDDTGKVLIKRKNLKNTKQRQAYTLIHRLIWNLKKILDLLPPTRTKLGSFITALWLLKEQINKEHNTNYTDYDILKLYNHANTINAIPKTELMNEYRINLIGKNTEENSVNFNKFFEKFTYKSNDIIADISKISHNDLLTDCILLEVKNQAIVNKNTIKIGKYVLNNQIIEVKTDLVPFAKFLNIPIFVYDNKVFSLMELQDANIQ